MSRGQEAALHGENIPECQCDDYFSASKQWRKRADQPSSTALEDRDAGVSFDREPRDSVLLGVRALFTLCPFETKGVSRAGAVRG